MKSAKIQPRNKHKHSSTISTELLKPTPTDYEPPQDPVKPLINTKTFKLPEFYSPRCIPSNNSLSSKELKRSMNRQNPLIKAFNQQKQYHVIQKDIYDNQNQVKSMARILSAEISDTRSVFLERQFSQNPKKTENEISLLKNNEFTPIKGNNRPSLSTFKTPKGALELHHLFTQNEIVKSEPTQIYDVKVEPRNLKKVFQDSKLKRKNDLVESILHKHTTSIDCNENYCIIESRNLESANSKNSEHMINKMMDKFAQNSFQSVILKPSNNNNERDSLTSAMKQHRQIMTSRANESRNHKLYSPLISGVANDMRYDPMSPPKKEFYKPVHHSDVVYSERDVVKMHKINNPNFAYGLKNNDIQKKSKNEVQEAVSENSEIKTIEQILHCNDNREKSNLNENLTECIEYLEKTKPGVVVYMKNCELQREAEQNIKKNNKLPNTLNYAKRYFHESQQMGILEEDTQNRRSSKQIGREIERKASTFFLKNPIEGLTDDISTSYKFIDPVNSSQKSRSPHKKPIFDAHDDLICEEEDSRSQHSTEHNKPHNLTKKFQKWDKQVKEDLSDKKRIIKDIYNNVTSEIDKEINHYGNNMIDVQIIDNPITSKDLKISQTLANQKAKIQRKSSHHSRNSSQNNSLRHICRKSSFERYQYDNKQSILQVKNVDSDIKVNKILKDVTGPSAINQFLNFDEIVPIQNQEDNSDLDSSMIDAMINPKKITKIDAQNTSHLTTMIEASNGRIKMEKKYENNKDRYGEIVKELYDSKHEISESGQEQFRSCHQGNIHYIIKYIRHNQYALKYKNAVFFILYKNLFRLVIISYTILPKDLQVKKIRPNSWKMSMFANYSTKKIW